MCGIVGMMTIRAPTSPRPELEESLQRATQSIFTRGPDDGGTWISPDGRVGFGHRRLSILDLSPRGHQPMLGARGSALTYNGEIYNYKDLRQELHSNPSADNFVSTSDTEVLLHALDSFGESCLNKLDGMFAFGYYSPQNSKLLLAVDPAGKKPIYTYWDGRTFAFASEIKALRELPNLDWQVDRYRLKESLIYGYVPWPYTMYSHVRKLPAGHFQFVDLNTGPQSVKAYWEVPLGQMQHRPNAKAQAELKELLSAAVRKRLVADVPVGCFLSGGLDSSAIAYEASRAHTGPLRTFSAGFSHDALSAVYDESQYARAVAKNIGSEHLELQVSGRDSRAAKVMAHFDEPYGDSSAIPTYL